MDTKKPDKSSLSFLVRNLAKGLGLLALFILAFVLFKLNGGKEYVTWLEPVYSNVPLVFSIYIISEVFFGIITPELFMAWGLRYDSNFIYIVIVLALAIISYGAGWLNYFIGLKSRRIIWIRWLISRRLKKSSRLLHQYGDVLIIVAAVTPVPYAAVCLLVGSTDYSKKKFLTYSLFRIARFMLYGFLVWSANQFS